MTKKQHTLIIAYNEFYPENPPKFYEQITQGGELVEERELKRMPRSARFDKILENPSGDHNQWNVHKARRIYSHPLLRP